MKFDIFTNCPYRVYIRNRHKSIIYANEAAFDFLGINDKLIMGKRYDNIFMDEQFILQLQKVDQILFSEKVKYFISIHEYNKCYKREKIFKMLDYLYEDNGEKYIITQLIEMSDIYCKDKGIDIKIGKYDPSNRLIKLESGKKIVLTRLENSFLFLLYEKKGNLAFYDELFLTLDINNNMSKTSLKALIYRLKKKLVVNIIENVSMEGYRLNIFDDM